MAATVEVVAAAILRDGCVLAARRTRPAQLAGRWEFPGGKVEPGEASAEALLRECAEELGVTVAVDGEPAVAERPPLRLTLWAARLTAGTPRASAAGGHDRLCWLGPADLDALDWLPADRELLPAVHAMLQPGAARGPSPER